MYFKLRMTSLGHA